MRKLLIHSLLLMGIVILLNQLGVYSGNLYKDGASLVCQEKRKAVRENHWDIPADRDVVLFFGASGVLSSLIPEVFDSLMYQKTYSLNLALPALPIGPYYHTLIEYLEQHSPPKYIIMTYRVNKQTELLFDRYANQGINFPRETLSYFIHRKNKNQTLNYLLPSHVYRKSIGKYLYNYLVHPGAIEKKKRNNRQIINQMIKDRGYYYILEQSRFPHNVLPKDYQEENDCNSCPMTVYHPDSDVYVEKFFNLTEQFDIKVFLITHPIRKGKYGQFEKTPEPIKLLISKYDHITIPREGWKLPLYANRYFSDPHHLNKEGAYRFTKEIATAFSNAYPSLEHWVQKNKTDQQPDHQQSQVESIP
jgi:hypothetical protein